MSYLREDFWATTSNKQLNFLQHIRSMLHIGGEAGVVLPDNVLFEGGAGETVRRRLLHECDVHTLLRLPTGIFYAQGVKANVIFFTRKAASSTPHTRELWVYDFRTNQRFTLKNRTLTRADLDPFVAAYRPGERKKRAETVDFKRYAYDELEARPGFNLDIWASVVDNSLSDPASLPAPEVIAAQIVEDATAGIEAFAAIGAELASANGNGSSTAEQDALGALLPNEPAA
jgi:type I restriction enzyme M protein